MLVYCFFVCPQIDLYPFYVPHLGFWDPRRCSSPVRGMICQGIYVLFPQSLLAFLPSDPLVSGRYSFVKSTPSLRARTQSQASLSQMSRLPHALRSLARSALDTISRHIPRELLQSLFPSTVAPCRRPEKMNVWGSEAPFIPSGHPL